MACDTRIPLFLAALLFATPALAQDDDDWLRDEDDDTTDEDEEVPGGDGWEEEEDETPDFNDDDDDPFSEDGVERAVEGGDTADIYRDYMAEVRGLPPDEEAIAWERYLEKYPNTSYRSRIDDRLSELERQMFEGGGRRIGGTSSVDAGRKELHFAQPMTLENIDPITKLRVGFGMGLPSYFNLIADFEYQIFRELSVHAGVQRRFTPGSSIELGARYALVKSARTRTLVTAIGDLRLGTNPFYPALRPQLAVGQRFNLGESHLDVQLQGGTDMTFIQGSSGDVIPEARLIGGGNLTLVPADRVRVFMETSVYMKDFGFEGGAFVFNQLTFGLKIMGESRPQTDDPTFEAGFAANAPYMARYWGYHLGAISGDLNYYLSDN